MNSNMMRSVWGLPPKLPRNTGWPKAVLRDVILFEYKSLNPVETNVNNRIAVDYGCRDEAIHWGDCKEIQMRKDISVITISPPRYPNFAQFIKRRSITDTPCPSPVSNPILIKKEPVSSKKNMLSSVNWAAIVASKKK